MHLLPSSGILFAASLFVLSWSTFVLAATTVSINSSGDKSYTVQGSGMSGVAGMHLDIKYDSTSLSTPTVTQGALVAGAMLASNTTSPGSIRIAVIGSRHFSDNGQIASISFASKTGSGGITSTNVSLIDDKGSDVAASASYSNSSVSTSADQPGTTSTAANQPSPTIQTPAGSSTPGTTTSSTTTYVGTVTLPADIKQQAEKQPVATPPPYTAEQIATRSTEQTVAAEKPAADVKAGETPQYISYKGISDRFKLYKGRKKLSDVVALFDKKVAQNIGQEPTLLLSDGIMKATLTVDLPARISSATNFAVNGGKLVSFKQDKTVKGRWIVEVLPEVGTVKTILTIIAGVEEFEYPLSVAPPVKTTLTLDENGWNRFLKEVGTVKAPMHDLNNDGARDYLDEFIFVANYLAYKAAPAKPADVKAPKKK